MRTFFIRANTPIAKMTADRTGKSKSYKQKLCRSNRPAVKQDGYFFPTPTDVGFEKLTIFVIQGQGCAIFSQRFPSALRKLSSLFACFLLIPHNDRDKFFRMQVCLG